MRRALSIFLYVIGGMFLSTEMMVAFVSLPDGDLGKLAAMAFMLVFALAPLGLGALASPGRRRWELGFVTLITAGWTAFTIVMIAYMMVMPDTAYLFPDDLRAMFGDYAFGIANIAAITAIGWALMKWGGKPRRHTEP